MIAINKKVIDRIINHAIKDNPIEACGYLAGSDNIITHFFSLTNVDNSPEHFTFSPDEQFNVFRETRDKNLTLYAVYHSHPKTPARPSAEDIKLAYDPNINYIIISLASEEPDIKCFKIIESKVIQEKLEVSE